MARAQASKHGVAFNDIYWKRHLQALKPIALASMLGSRMPLPDTSAVETVHKLQNKRRERRRRHQKRRDKRARDKKAADDAVNTANAIVTAAQEASTKQEADKASSVTGGASQRSLFPLKSPSLGHATSVPPPAAGRSTVLAVSPPIVAVSCRRCA